MNCVGLLKNMNSNYTSFFKVEVSARLSPDTNMLSNNVQTFKKAVISYSFFSLLKSEYHTDKPESKY